MCSPGQRLKSFRISCSSLGDRDRVIISGSASSSCSCDKPGSPSSFAKRAVFFEYFFFSIGATDTGMGWFSGSAAVPVTGVGVTVVPIAGVRGAAEPVTGVRVAAVPVCCWGQSGCSVCCWGRSGCSACHSVVRSRDLFFHLRVLNSVKQGSVGMSQAPAHCSDLCLPGIVRVTAYFFQMFTSFSGFCACSGVKFQNTGGAHCPRHLPMLPHTPCHS